MKKLKLLVTGANGFIGHHLCRRLIDNKHEVLAVTRSEKPLQLKSLLKKSGLILQVGDITNQTFVGDLFNSNKIDVVFHLAIESDYSNIKNPTAPLFLPDTNAYKTNVGGTFNLLHRALENGTSLFIHSSSMSVYDYENPNYLPVNETHPTKPINFYGLTKLLSEEICQYYNANTKLKTLILRYSGVFGPGKNRGIIAKLVQSCLSPKSEPIDVDENRTSDFVYVDDVVIANILAMELTMSSSLNPKADQHIFHIGSGVETSIKELAEMIIGITKANININPVSSRHARRFYFDINVARSILNYYPRDIYQGLVEYVQKERIEGGALAG